VDVDFDAKTATVKMARGKTLSKEKCEEAFGGTNYKVAKFDALNG
jgi:hypothetical protein